MNWLWATTRDWSRTIFLFIFWLLFFLTWQSSFVVTWILSYQYLIWFVISNLGLQYLNLAFVFIKNDIRHSYHNYIYSLVSSLYTPLIVHICEPCLHTYTRSIHWKKAVSSVDKGARWWVFCMKDFFCALLTLLTFPSCPHLNSCIHNTAPPPRNFCGFYLFIVWRTISFFLVIQTVLK
jgi:hypothetical protein